MYVQAHGNLTLNRCTAIIETPTFSSLYSIPPLYPAKRGTLTYIRLYVRAYVNLCPCCLTRTGPTYATGEGLAPLCAPLCEYVTKAP